MLKPSLTKQITCGIFSPTSKCHLKKTSVRLSKSGFHNILDLKQWRVLLNSLSAWNNMAVSTFISLKTQVMTQCQTPLKAPISRPPSLFFVVAKWSVTADWTEKLIARHATYSVFFFLQSVRKIFVFAILPALNQCKWVLWEKTWTLSPVDSLSLVNVLIEFQTWSLMNVAKIQRVPPTG